MKNHLVVREFGFTMVESIIVISILGIILSLSAPSFSGMIKRQKATGEANNLVSLIYLSRSEAIKNNQVVTLCRSSNGQVCGNSWSEGWLMFVDNNRNGAKDLHEKIIRSGHAGNGYQISFSAFGSNRYMRFSPLGITLSQNGTFKLCPEDNDSRYARAVIISKTARTRLAKDSDGDGVYEAADGTPLNCRL
ncbi:MAG: GspH/FimT family protein [gamma proteobacterium symbiont of Taylorina sp.]|nr:GspH/FimT family protein [gamma proteobacterium symbiont of Taylorina sp.]